MVLTAVSMERGAWSVWCGGSESRVQAAGGEQPALPRGFALRTLTLHGEG